jgi:hypothetical protein
MITKAFVNVRIFSSMCSARRRWPTFWIQILDNGPAQRVSQALAGGSGSCERRRGHDRNGRNASILHDRRPYFN